MSPTKSHVRTLIASINYHLLPRLGTLAVEEFNGERFRKFIQDVLETPAKHGNRKLEPHRLIETLDDESLRKRKSIANTLIGILRGCLQMAWENGKTNNDRGWRT